MSTLEESPLDSRMICAGCDRALPPDEPQPFRCPGAATEPGVDHLLARRLELPGSVFEADDDPNPFVRHRGLLHAWRLARRRGLADAEYVALVRELDAAVARVDGHGFVTTPFTRSDALSDELGLDGGVWVKDETGNVSGTHKGRHLFGLALWLAVVRRVGLEGAERDAPLAIASCGNAALAAAVVARAIERRLQVFVPPDAEPSVLTRLEELGAELVVCAREAGAPPGDPCVLRFRAAVAAGALPFTCQGDANGLAVEGGHTLGWELAAQRAGAPIDRLLIQVGGGALASGLVHGLHEAVALGALPRMPRVHAVQTAACHPLARAWRRVAEDVAAGECGAGTPDHELAACVAGRGEPAAIAAAMGRARRDRARVMQPWPAAPESLAAAILDDETYDWAVPVEAMLATGGWPLVVEEETIRTGWERARRATGIDVCPSGAAGLAGALDLRALGVLQGDETLAVLFTGVRRGTRR